MTSLPRLMAVADARDDASAELANVRAAYAAACAELVDVRRQRDEAVAHGQELLSRLVEADEKLASAAEPAARPLPMETSVAPASAADTGIPAGEPIRIAPSLPTPTPISPVPTIVGSEAAPVAPALVASVVDGADSDDEDDEAAVDAVVLPLAEVVPAQPVRWLPPEEDGAPSSMAHEFAALKGLDSEPAEEAPAATEPLASPMNVLPDAPVESKGSRWRLRTR